MVTRFWVSGGVPDEVFGAMDFRVAPDDMDFDLN
jgi:hypothetical protein